MVLIPPVSGGGPNVLHDGGGVMSRKTRTVPFHLGTGRLSKSVVSEPPGFTSYCPHLSDTVLTASLGTLNGSQVTDSENNHWRKGKFNPVAGDIGSEFYTQKKYFSGKPENVSTGYAFTPASWPCGYDSRYVGPVWPCGTGTLQFPPAMNSSDSELLALGAVAVSRCKPTNAVVNLSTFLSELVREGIPHLPATDWEAGIRAARKSGDTTSINRKVGDDWLNFQFGWKPVISDIEKVTGQLADAERIITQYERDAGRVVRRNYGFPDRDEVLQVTEFPRYDVPVPYFVPYDYAVASPSVDVTVRQVRRISQKRWFSGAFSYYLPTGYDSREAMKSNVSKLEHLFDLTITAETLWNLAPWSWAADWFSNTGDVISNITSWATDGLVMRYGYLMEHTLVSDTYTMKNPSSAFRGGGMSSSPVLNLVTETKIRKKANPFGFGITWDGLSPTQLSIAAALGISRGSR